MDADVLERRTAVIKELDGLNLVRDHLTPAALIQTPTLLDLLGKGDPEEAFIRLCAAADDHATDQYVAAVFACIGLSVHGRTVEDRMAEHGERLSKKRGSRTIRRRAERGVEVLADLITRGQIRRDPTIIVTLYRDYIAISGMGAKGLIDEDKAITEDLDLSDLVLDLITPVLPMERRDSSLYLFNDVSPDAKIYLHLLWRGETSVNFSFGVEGRSGKARMMAWDGRGAFVMCDGDAAGLTP